MFSQNKPSSYAGKVLDESNLYSMNDYLQVKDLTASRTIDKILGALNTRKMGEMINTARTQERPSRR